jgi:hypothetical protein
VVVVQLHFGEGIALALLDLLAVGHTSEAVVIAEWVVVDIHREQDLVVDVVMYLDRPLLEPVVVLLVMK